MQSLGLNQNIPTNKGAQEFFKVYDKVFDFLVSKLKINLYNTKYNWIYIVHVYYRFTRISVSHEERPKDPPE